MYIDGSISSGLSRAWSRAYMRASVEAAGPHRGTAPPPHRPVTHSNTFARYGCHIHIPNHT
jgi:hypothetical protein